MDFLDSSTGLVDDGRLTDDNDQRELDDGIKEGEAGEEIGVVAVPLDFGEPLGLVLLLLLLALVLLLDKPLREVPDKLETILLFRPVLFEAEVA